MTRKKRPASRLREVVLPHDLTTTIVSFIDNLPSSVKTDYLKKEMMSKYVSRDTDPPEIRRDRAIEKWRWTERENEATNDRLFITPEEYNILPRVTFHTFVEWCRDFIVRVIGDTPPVDALIGAFSGGASTSRSRTSSQPALKYLGKAHVTASAKEVFEDLVVPEIPLWFNPQLELPCVPVVYPSPEMEVVRGNVMFTVPKKTDIDRVACKEPDLNMFIQKGIGDYFRSRLRRVGINLNDQSINRSLAHEGSIDGSLATLDLSSASDSVTTGLVSLFLPVTWYTLLDSVRSPVTMIHGEEHRNEMFSSMGNGFTFELESLLFFTIVKAVAYFRGDLGKVSVYGDDIICPTACVPELVYALSYLGFTVNSEKSFDSGPFRESCGGHYHLGYDITPFYIKRPVDSLLEVIDVANKLRKWSAMGLTGSTGVLRWCDICDPDVEPLWLFLKSLVPQCLWGGEDLSFKYQLVSNDTAHSRLAETTKTKSTGYGGYLHWHNATWRRSHASDGLETSHFTVPVPGKVRIKRVRPTVPRLSAYWLSEL